MSKQHYNGWTNYETWLVKLWQDNDEGEQRFWSGMADKFIEESEPRHCMTSEDVARYDFADYLKDTYEDRAADVTVTGFWADLLGAALADVNWNAIAESWIGDAVEAASDEG